MKHIKQDFSLKACVRLRGWGQDTIQLFGDMVMLHIKLKQIMHTATLPAHTPLTPGGGFKWSKHFFF